MKHTFQTEVSRYGLELNYMKEYRYALPKGSMLSMHSDITATDDDLADYDPRIKDLKAKYDRLDNPEWLRRFIIGYFEKKTGKHIFTLPKPDRYKQIMTYLEERNILSPVVLMDHDLSLDDANEYATLNRYNQLADQSMLSGTFRGWFYGSTITPTCLIQTVLIIHQVKGEDAFRIRKGQTLYDNHSFLDEPEFLLRAQKNDWDDFKITDGFASFSTEFGRGYLMNDKSPDFDMGNFMFDKAGRRMKSMDANIDGHKTRLNLPQRPAGIDFVIRLLQSIKI